VGQQCLPTVTAIGLSHHFGSWHRQLSRRLEIQHRKGNIFSDN